MPYLAAVILFGVVILVHELGHFFMAKLFRMDVLRLSLGFGPVLFSFKRGRTEYAVSAIPVGGYVKLAEEDDARKDPSITPYERHPWYQKTLMALMGTGFNLVLGFIVIWALVLWKGTYDYKPVVGEVLKDSPAEKAELKAGDIILSINGKPVHYWSDIPGLVNSSKGAPLVFTIKRGEKTLTVTITPKKVSEEVDKGIYLDRWMVGIKADEKHLIHIKPGFVASVGEAVRMCGNIVRIVFDSLGKLFTNKEAYKQIGGPIAIGKMASDSFRSGLVSYFYFMAAISIMIGLFNLLPIPPLDGFLGIVFFFEGMIGRPMGERFRTAVQIVGVIIFVSLFILAFYNDIMRLMS